MEQIENDQEHKHNTITQDNLFEFYRTLHQAKAEYIFFFSFFKIIWEREHAS